MKRDPDDQALFDTMRTFVGPGLETILKRFLAEGWTTTYQLTKVGRAHQAQALATQHRARAQTMQGISAHDPRYCNNWWSIWKLNSGCRRVKK